MKLTITEYSLTASAQLDYNIQKERTLHLVYCEGTSLAELVWPFNRLNIDGPLHIANQTVVLFETLQALSATVLWAPWYSSITQDRARGFRMQGKTGPVHGRRPKKNVQLQQGSGSQGKTPRAPALCGSSVLKHGAGTTLKNSAAPFLDIGLCSVLHVPSEVMILFV